MTDFLRLIESAFSLKQASLDSVHGKNVRSAHISTLQIWPARRSAAAPQSYRQHRGPTAAEVAAMFKTDKPVPSDEECQRILDEELTENYSS